MNNIKTLEQAVEEIVSGFISQNKNFSAHEVTSEVRNQVNSRTLTVVGIPMGYVDSQNPNSQQITHSDVKDIVTDIAQTRGLSVVSYKGYRVFGISIATTGSTGSTGSTGVAQAILTTPIAAVKSTAIAVPVRFTTGIKADIKARITRYVRKNLEDKSMFTIRSVQKAVKNGITVDEISKVIIGEGWKLDGQGALSNQFISK